MAANSKSPAELKSEGEELKALFAKVKKKQHNCAVLMAKDGIVVEVHIKKSPEVLVKAAKKNGGMAKGVWGTMTMEGQVIHIDPINDKIPGNLTKLAKKFFTARGLKLRMEIVEPEEGEASEETAAEDSSESAAGTADEGGSEAPETGDQKEALEAELAAMQEDIDALQADTENVMYSALQDALAAHQRAMDGEDYERGEGTLNVLKVVLEDYEGLMAEKRPLAARMEALAPAAERVKSGDNSEAADQIGRTMREFDYALANNEWIGAADKLDVIEQLTETHDGGEEDAPETEESGVSETGGETESSSADEESVDYGENPEAATHDVQAKEELAQWLATNKKRINAVLKNRETEIALLLTEQLGNYAKALKKEKMGQAEDAIDEVELLLERADSEFSLTDGQRAAIEKEVQKIESEIAALASQLEE